MCIIPVLIPAVTFPTNWNVHKIVRYSEDMLVKIVTIIIFIVMCLEALIRVRNGADVGKKKILAYTTESFGFLAIIMMRCEEMQSDYLAYGCTTKHNI